MDIPLFLAGGFKIISALERERYFEFQRAGYTFLWAARQDKPATDPNGTHILFKLIAVFKKHQENHLSLS